MVFGGTAIRKPGPHSHNPKAQHPPSFSVGPISPDPLRPDLQADAQAKEVLDVYLQLAQAQGFQLSGLRV